MYQNFRLFGAFLSLLSIFGPINLFKGMCRPDVIPSLMLSVITFEPIIRFRKSWAFWKALEMGYLIVLKIKKYVKSALLPPRGP